LESREEVKWQQSASTSEFRVVAKKAAISVNLGSAEVVAAESAILGYK
jgi:hypothetical protein